MCKDSVSLSLLSHPYRSIVETLNYYNYYYRWYHDTSKRFKYNISTYGMYYGK